MVIPNYSSKFSRAFSLELVKGNWDRATVPLELHPKAVYCRNRWVDGLDWNSTIAPDYHMKMIKDHGSFDKCKNVLDVTERLSELDLVYSLVNKNRRFMTRFELSFSDNPRDETGGIYVHFDRYGDPIFAGGGWHRLMIAKILQIELIPIQVGLIHQDFSKKVDLSEWLNLKSD
jgi:hypothetical protein